MCVRLNVTHTFACINAYKCTLICIDVYYESRGWNKNRGVSFLYACRFIRTWQPLRWLFTPGPRIWRGNVGRRKASIRRNNEKVRYRLENPLRDETLGCSLLFLFPCQFLRFTRCRSREMRQRGFSRHHVYGTCFYWFPRAPRARDTREMRNGGWKQQRGGLSSEGVGLCKVPGIPACAFARCSRDAVLRLSPSLLSSSRYSSTIDA